MRRLPIYKLEFVVHPREVHVHFRQLNDFGLRVFRLHLGFRFSRILGAAKFRAGLRVGPDQNRPRPRASSAQIPYECE